MINLSATSVGAGSGHSSKIQGQAPTAGASGPGFPPLAGFGNGSRESLSSLSGQGFGGGAPSSGESLPPGDDFVSLSGLSGEGQTSQLLDGATLLMGARETVDAPVVASSVAGFVSAAAVSEDLAQGFAGLNSSAGSSTPATVGLGDSDLSVPAHGQPQSLLSQGIPHGGGRESVQGAAQHHAQQAPAQTGMQELSRAMAPMLGNAGPQTTLLRGSADVATLMPAAQAPQADGTLLATGAARSGTAVIPEWSPVRVDAQQAHWGRDLMAALAERVEMQISQQIKQARIRLDPPELGRLQLTVRLEGDRLSVQFNASHAQVREALHHQQDRLRADLAGEYGEGVEVSVGHDQGRQRSPTGGQPWEAFEMGAGIGLTVADGNLDGSETDRGRATSGPDSKSWVNALV